MSPASNCKSEENIKRINRDCQSEWWIKCGQRRGDWMRKGTAWLNLRENTRGNEKVEIKEYSILHLLAQQKYSDTDLYF